MKKVNIDNKVKKEVSEFKKFISRGSVFDMAVGVIIGSAFANIVSSLVDDIIMPIVGIFLGGLDFSSLKIEVGDASIMYGAFIQRVVDFLIIALCIFLLLKIMNSLRDKAIPKKKEKVEKREEVVLLEDIKNLLVNIEKGDN